MDAIAIFGFVETLPEDVQQTLRREALKRQIPLEAVIREALIELADNINGPAPSGGDATQTDAEAAA